MGGTQGPGARAAREAPGGSGPPTSCVVSRSPLPTEAVTLTRAVGLPTPVLGRCCGPCVSRGSAWSLPGLQGWGVWESWCFIPWWPSHQPSAPGKAGGVPHECQRCPRQGMTRGAECGPSQGGVCTSRQSRRRRGRALVGWGLGQEKGQGPGGLGAGAGGRRRNRALEGWGRAMGRGQGPDTGRQGCLAGHLGHQLGTLWACVGVQESQPRQPSEQMRLSPAESHEAGAFFLETL